MNARYKRMLQGMKMSLEEQLRLFKKTRKKCFSREEDQWILYILECGDGSYYTGITKNLENRLKKHNDGKGAAYTRSHRPVKLIYQEKCSNRASALIREMKVKSLNRKEKEKLVKKFAILHYGIK